MISPLTQFSVVRPVDVRNPLVEYATRPYIYNIPMPEVDTEYAQILPVDTKKFLMHTRDGTEFRLAFDPGKVAGQCAPFFTVPVNTAYNEDFIDTSGLALYFAGICTGLTMEILAWT